MDREATTAQVLRHLRETFPGSPIERDTALLESVLADSFAFLQAVMFLEEQFGLTIERADMDPHHFDTPETLAALILSKRA